MLEEITNKFCTTKGKDIKVLRLPVAHSELNPIELIWAQIKGYVAVNNTTFKIKDVKKLAEEAFTKVTDRNWMRAVKHTLKVENLFRKKDFPDNLPSVAPVVFQVKPDHLESSSSEDETSSEGTSDSLSDTNIDSLTS